MTYYKIYIKQIINCIVEVIAKYTIKTNFDFLISWLVGRRKKKL